MDDERKKPARGKPARSFGGTRPAKGGEGGKTFRKPGGPRPFDKGGDRPSRAEGDRPFRKPFVKREDGEERPFRRPFAKREDGGGDKPYRKPFVKREDSGGEKPFRKSFTKREDSGGEKSFRKPFAKREDGGGDRPFGKSASGDRPPRDRPERSEGFRSRTPRDDRSAPRTEAEDGGERIAKRLARAGLASRRDAEALIASGRIKVNGKVLDSPAFNVSASDRIELDGVAIPAIERTRLFVFNKPAGVVTTNRDPEGRRTVFDVLPQGLPRLMTVGRLDINTEGLLLLTNDGGLARVMELPATGWLRRYRVRVHRAVDEKALEDLRDGVAVDGVFYGAIEAQLDRAQGTNAWLTIGLREGKNREVKNILGSLGLEVTRLIRISYGPFQLGELPEGHVMEIKGRTLREQLGERLIEESGANFEADIAAPFPNRPVRRGENWAAPQDKAPRQRRETLKEGAGGLVKNFRRDKDRKRTDDLDRWSTSRDDSTRQFKRGDDAGRPARKPFGDKPKFGDKPRTAGRGKPAGDREERPVVEPGARRANVWMAPGAKPQGKRPSERAADKREQRPPRKSDGFRGSRPNGGGKGRPGGGGPRSGPRSPGKPRGGKS